MLNSISFIKKLNLPMAILFIALSSLCSCIPTSKAPSLNSGSSTDNPTSGNTNNLYPEPTFPLNGIFVQEGALRTNTNMSLPLDFSDSFLIRGLSLSKYLRTIPLTTKICLSAKYTYNAGNDRFLLLSAKPKGYTDLTKKTTEYYLQVEPSNDQANQNDCLTYNLTNSLFQNAATPSVHFSINQLCQNCTSSVTSSGFRLYFFNGEEVPSLTLSLLTLTLSGRTTSSVNSCSDSSSCIARKFDCCLEGQCVNDKAIRPGVINLPGFTAAQEDVRLNPSRYVIYPQFYFVCNTKPGNDNTTPSPVTDPDYDSSVRLMELKQLFNCINKVDGEFSFCTLKYAQANEKIPGVFNAANDGYNDDINFSSLNPNFLSGTKSNNIVEIIYAGQTIYSESGNIALPVGNNFVANTANDNLTTAQGVNLNLPYPSNAKDANLYITYKVDGTCERVSSTTAKCTKTYIQSYSDTASTFWHDSSKVFLLPSYADLSSTASLIVKVSGIVVPEDETATWTKSQSPNKITFVNSYALYQNQTIEITYFVKTGASDLIKLRTAAQQTVNTMCSCASSAKCNLKPVLDAKNISIVNYDCSYPTASSDEPAVNQTVYVSNKNIPHRYFDANGVSYDENYSGALDQELNAFAYTNNDNLKPNNVNQYIGFNEIYGSFARTGFSSARPAKMVRVKKDKLYDILVNSGSFSSCLTCGSDYYTSLQKIFPQNFGAQGGGYAPENYENRRENNSSLYRSDDLLFGRACFVPATMIPWTHFAGNSPRDQRRNRLAAQHFLFANGYNRDWYGFDYGSLIGSFDGVTWFSIGNQRRVKAASNKLYLAVNAYLGDLNIDNNFNVNVSETSAFSSDIPDHDTKTDGAQCQRSHFCSNDNDCFRQLGYDYTCQNVSSVLTNWPQFDANAAEIVGSTERSLSTIVGGTSGQPKRCVYRGRGAPCLQDLNLATTATTFNSTTVVGHLTCSHNNSCVGLSTLNRFNDRIARFANTPAAQNNANIAATKTDTVGLGARVILRPYDYYGDKSAPSGAQSTLIANNVQSICIPGRDVNLATNTFDLNKNHPSLRTETSDKILGIAPTVNTLVSTKMLMACPATDAMGTSLLNFKLNASDPTLDMFTITQNMSSNLLDLAPLRAQNIFSSTSGSQITAIGYQKNTCLRAPGASCFSDMDCAPSTFIANKVKASNLSSLLNSAEIKFWQEELVCGNPDFKFIAPGVLNTQFDVKKNKCCREFGKTISVSTQTTGPAHQWCDNTTSTIKVAGTNQSIATFSRYSRIHSVYDKMTCDRTQLPSKSFALSLVAGDFDQRWTQIQAQYKTLDLLNQRTCCTNHWVRSFASENGGGHAFVKTKMQNIDKQMFRDISWQEDKQPPTIPFATDPDGKFECATDQYLTSSCEIKNLTPAEEDNYLTWAGALELIGIPQVAIKTTDDISRIVDENQAAAPPNTPLLDSEKRPLMLQVTDTLADFRDSSTGKRYYSGINYTGLNLGNNGLKKVFSEDEFNCCISSGQEVPQTTTAAQCCTGFAATFSGQKRCCLPDFTDITVYLNRYVSSEGRGLPDSAYDSSTGYIKDPGQVQLLAAQKNLCCSGKVMTGVAISQLPIPLTNNTYKAADAGASTRRFNYRTDDVDNNSESGSVGSIFDAGVRWNNHVYCVPSSFGNQ
jgi:hypothetical protein